MKLIDTGKASAERNMSIDQELLNTLESEAILHLYDWEAPSATYGHFSDPEVLLNVPAARALGYQLAKRPTGGGVIFHTTDYAFSVLIPASHPLYSENTLDNYNVINTQVAKVITEYSNGALKPSFQPCPSKQDRPTYCMVRPTCYDLVVEGRKVVGAAQRRTKRGLLHQGSISLFFPSEVEQLVDQQVAEQMKTSSYYLLQAKSEIEKARNELHKLLVKAFLLH
jgi:lipoate-protein ligase A